MSAPHILRWLQSYTHSMRLREIAAQSIRLGRSLTSISDSELANRADDCRTSGLSGDPSSTIESVALVSEAVRREKGFDPYPEQVLGACAVANRHIIDMKTGEGKSIVAVMACFILAMRGKGVHLATTNSYLASRDAESAAAILSRLGCSVRAIIDNDVSGANRGSYQADVTVGPGYQFGFDYLKDQANLREENIDRLGQKIVRNLHGVERSGLIQARPPAYAVIDEADSVLIDEAMTPMILSGGHASPPNRTPFARAAVAANSLQFSEDFIEQKHRIFLTAQGREKAIASYPNAARLPLERPWVHYVENALTAQWSYKNGEHYVVVDSEVRIVDQHTGRIFEDRSWQNGLHQAIEFKEGVPLTPSKKILARVTRQRYFQRYESVAGMTGTVLCLGPELHQTYRSKTVIIPPHRPNRRCDLPALSYAGWEAKIRGICTEVKEHHSLKRPILIGTRTIRESQTIADALSAQGLSCTVLNGLQDRDEAEIIAQAGECSSITVATNMAGRGTDIPLSDDAKNAGGLHVIGTESHESARTDAQLIGRAGRQGDPGSSRFFISCEDNLFEDCDEKWLAKLKQGCSADGACKIDLSKLASQIQNKTEQLQQLQRQELLVHDRWLDSVKEEYEATR